MFDSSELLANGATHQNGVTSVDTNDKQVGVLEQFKGLLSSDTKVKVAGVDFDGILRGKIMAKDKFLSSIKAGFGMSSAVFGWDMHDVLYTTETAITSSEDGYADMIAEIDLNSMRRLVFEDNIPFFLLRFSINGKPVCADGRGVLASMDHELAQSEVKAFAGVELEFMNFQTPSEDGYNAQGSKHNLAAFLKENAVVKLRPLTTGMFGYSVSRPVMSKKYFHDIFDKALEIGCPVEGWHTESGPGVYEAALAVSPVSRMADNVTLFKLLARSLGIEQGVTPCFMAKPIEGLPGNSGHIHISITDLEGKNLFARDYKDDAAPWEDIEFLSDTGRSFLAGLLEALPDIMPLLAPNINSYKRLIENYWAPVTIGWGLEDRLASVRLIAPPVCKPSATRFEIRIPGADLHPHYALAAIFKSGWRGVQKKLSLTLPPAAKLKGQKPTRLPNSLNIALERFSSQSSLSREIFGNDFVDAYTLSRQHELRVWREAVTDWEFKRYIETV